MKQIRMTDSVNGLLTLLSEKRKEAGALTSTKQGIVAELIINAHKKEFKKDSGK